MRNEKNLSRKLNDGGKRKDLDFPETPSSSGVPLQIVILVAIVSAAVSWLVAAKIVPVSVSLIDTGTPVSGLLGAPVLISRDPVIWQIDDFLSPNECDHLANMAEGQWTKSAVTVPDGQGKSLTKQRDSFTFYATREMRGKKVTDEIVVGLLDKIHDTARIPREYGFGEDLQLTKYLKGMRYTLHPDSGMEIGRMVTVLVYINDVEDGGETVFPYAKAVDPFLRSRSQRRYEQLRNNPHLRHDDKELDQFCRGSDTLKVKPKKGRAVMWHNHLPDLNFNDRSFHAGCPVLQGEKLIAQRWIRWYDQSKTANPMYQLVQAQQQHPQGDNGAF